MKNKGFSLIELLGSITLLAIIAIIAFPAILNLLAGSQNEIDKAMKEYVVSAAREYVNDNIDEFSTSPSLNKKVCIQSLIDKGYISDTTINEKKNSDLKNDAITITNNGTKYVYEYKKDEC